MNTSWNEKGWYLLTVFVFTGRLLNISIPVKAESSSFWNSSGQCFLPELAIQADTSYACANCFVSKKEPNPWFRLEFKSLTSIFNVRLTVRDRCSEQLPHDYNLSAMANLSVYVGNSRADNTKDNTRCGNPWSYRKIRIINLKCATTLTGKYVQVIVPSLSPTYLMICSIVFNRDDGTMSSLVKKNEKVSIRADSSCFMASVPAWVTVEVRTYRE